MSYIVKMAEQTGNEESYKIKLYMKSPLLMMYSSSKKCELFTLSSVKDLKQYRELAKDPFQRNASYVSFHLDEEIK